MDAYLDVGLLLEPAKHERRKLHGDGVADAGAIIGQRRAAVQQEERGGVEQADLNSRVGVSAWQWCGHDTRECHKRQRLPLTW